MLIQLLATWIPALLIGLSGVLKLTAIRRLLARRGSKCFGRNPTPAHGDGRFNVTDGTTYFCRLDRLVLLQLAAESAPRCLPHERIRASVLVTSLLA